MARIFKILGRDIVIGKRLFGYGKDSESFGVANMVNADATADSLDNYKNLVYGCINLIAEAVGTYQPIISTKGKDGKAVDTHPLLDLLQRPSGRGDKAVNTTMFDLLYATASFIELQGSCYWYIGKGRTTGMPREIVLLRADRVGSDKDKDTGEITQYWVRQQGGSKIYIPIDEILPFIGFNPRNPYNSVSTTEAAADYIATDQLTNEFTKNFFKNNAGVSGVLSIQGEVTKDGFKKLVRAFRSKYEGVDHAGKVMIIRGDEAKFTKFGLGLDQLDMPVLRKMSRDDIGLMYRVPTVLLGLHEGSIGLGRNMIEAHEYVFTKWNIEPKMKKIDAVLQIAIDRYYGGRHTVTHKNIIPEDKEYNLKRDEAMIDKTITRNEARKREGLDDIKGGDRLYIPMSNISIDEAAAPEAEKSAAKGITITRKRVIQAGPVAKDLSLTTERKEAFRLRLMKNQEAYERKFKKAVKPIFKDQRAEALKNLEAHASSEKSMTKALDQKFFDDAKYDALLAAALKTVNEDLATQQGALALKFAGDDDSEFKLTAKLIKILADRTSKMASNFNDETLEKLNKTLAEGIQDGEALNDLKKRVEDVYEGVDGYRAERIARTETLNASNEATIDAYRQTGYVTGKEWYANPGADEECEAMAGTQMGLDEVFLKQGESFSYEDKEGEEQTITNSYDDVNGPPLHVNCRCTIVPITEELKALKPIKVKEVPVPTEGAISKSELVEMQNYIAELEKLAGVSDDK